jgi:hypothetical protein
MSVANIALQHERDQFFSLYKPSVMSLIVEFIDIWLFVMFSGNVR